MVALSLADIWEITGTSSDIEYGQMIVGINIHQVVVILSHFNPAIKVEILAKPWIRVNVAVLSLNPQELGFVDFGSMRFKYFPIRGFPGQQ
jgi:hypothetical protein